MNEGTDENHVEPVLNGHLHHHLVVGDATSGVDIGGAHFILHHAKRSNGLSNGSASSSGFSNGSTSPDSPTKSLSSEDLQMSLSSLLTNENNVAADPSEEDMEER